MTGKARTGSVKAGRIKAKQIITGVKIEGAASDEVLKEAMRLARQFSTGDVTAKESLEADDIVVGFLYLNPDAPAREDFVAELQSLRETVAELQEQPQAPAEVGAAAKSLDEAIGEAQKEEPLGKLVVKRLHDAVEFITDAGKLWEASEKLAPLVARAVSTAVVLYQIAQKLF
jgi:hypothetical protein